MPFSLSDYPGKVAAIAFTQGCNFNCAYCHNRQLIQGSQTHLAGTGEITTEMILALLQKRMGQLDGLVITGGEPTCQKDLVPFAAAVKAMGYLIKLDTNGSLPQVVETLIHNNLVDYVAMDVKAPWRKYEQVVGTRIDSEKVRRSVALIAKSNVPFEFRVTAVSPLLSDDDVLNIGMEIGPLGPVYLQKFQMPADSGASGSTISTFSTSPGLQKVAHTLQNNFESVWVR